MRPGGSPGGGRCRHRHDAGVTSVELVRDVDGIAHVRAEDAAGAFFGQGVAAAQDRLWQMEYDRRRAAGRLAEIVGPRAVGSDIFHRRMGLAASARDDLRALGPDARAALDAYADGVNAHLLTLAPGDLPLELRLLGAVPEPWEPWESIAVFKVRHLLMGTYEVKLWRSALARRLGVETAARLWPAEPEITVVPGGPVQVARDLAADLGAVPDVLAGIPVEEGASNNVVVHGTRTATGLPLLAGDPHRALDLPNVYWQNHLTCDEFDVIGLSFPGVPGFPHFGHSATVAWCITHGMADDQDVYLERLRPDGEGGVAHEADGRWRAAAVRSETIAVAGQDPVTVTVVETVHGPVVAGDAGMGVGLALRWTALAAPDTTFDALVPMLRAATAAELDEAMRPWVAPVNNVLIADRDGDIAYRLRGRLARRPPANGWTIVPGWDGRHEWSGWVDYDDQPRVVNPEAGLLVTANNRLAVDGPYVSNDFAHPGRARRLTELVSGGDGWTAEALGAVLGDDRSPVADRFVDGLLAVPARHPLERTAQELLRGWDRRMAVDSAGAAVYAVCRVELLRAVAAAAALSDDDLGALRARPTLHQTSRFLWTRLVYLAGAADDTLVAGIGGWAGAYATALRWGVRALEVQLGDSSGWRWGRLHTVRWVHPLGALRPDLAGRLPAPGVVEVGGDADCVRATGIAPPGLAAVTGSVARYVFDLSDWDRSTWVVPHGVDGDSGGAHFADQLVPWAGLQMLLMRYSRHAVDAATASVATIERP